VDLLATCPPSLTGQLFNYPGLLILQGHGTLELKLDLYQLMTDYSSMGLREDTGSVGTEGA